MSSKHEKFCAFWCVCCAVLKQPGYFITKTNTEQQNILSHSKQDFLVLLLFMYKIAPVALNLL